MQRRDSLQGCGSSTTSLRHSENFTGFLFRNVYVSRTNVSRTKFCTTGFQTLKWTGSEVSCWWLSVNVFMSNRRYLRSSTSGVLYVPKTRACIGVRNFSVIEPVTWNDLPLEVCCMNSSVSHLQRNWRHIWWLSSIYCAAHLRCLANLRYLNGLVDWLIDRKSA